MKLSIGQVVDRKYTVERCLGAGGTAMVYLVRHHHLGTHHALKVLTITSQAIRDRMLREGQVQSQLKHLNVVAVTDVIDVDGSPGLLMEYVDGPSLEAALGRYRLTMGDAETLFVGILSGVRAAHEAGLVHRDLKPANVLLARTADGFVPKVTDFGLAKMLANDPSVAHTRSGIAMGTPSYMAPEQIRDARQVDQKADLWSLGCILYELCTRRRAFPGDEALAIYNAVVEGQFVPPRQYVPDLPERLEQAIHGCLRVDPHDRIPDCDTLLGVLHGVRSWPLPLHGPDARGPAPKSAPSLGADVPQMSVARRGPGGATPQPAPQRGAAPPAVVGGFEVVHEVAHDETEEVPETVLTQRGVDGTLAPPDSLERERTGFLGWLGGGLLAIGLVGLLVVATLAAGVAMVGSLILTRSAPPETQVVTAPEPARVAPPTPPVPAAAPLVAPAPAPAPQQPAPVAAPRPRPAPARPRPAPVPAPAVTAPAPAPEPAPAPAPAVEPAPAEPAPAAPEATTALPTLLRSYPPAATVTVDGVAMGRTPAKIELQPGRHAVIMTSGDQEGAFIVNLEPGGPSEWCYSFVQQTAVIGPCP